MRSLTLTAIIQLAGTVLALPTYTSTIISSSCSLGPSTFKYSNVTEPVTQIVAASSAASSSEEVIYETEEVTNESVFTTDKVVCSGGSCYTTTQLESWTTTTATIDGVLTTYVTHVPVSTSVSSATPSEKHSISHAPKPSFISETTSQSPKSSSASEKNTISQAPKPTAVTETNIGTTLVTITSCSDNKCEEIPVTTGVTVVTSTVKGKETVYTTYCPLSFEESSVKPTKTLHSTTILTVTSCSDHICYSSGITTGVTELTTTVNGIESVYTTYCPVESTTQSSVQIVGTPSSKETSKISAVTSTKVIKTQVGEASGTVNVITNNIVTQYSATSTAASATSSSTPRISTYEGVAAKAAPAVLGALPILLAFM